MLLWRQFISFSKVKIDSPLNWWIYFVAIVLIASLFFLPGLGSYGMLDPTDSFFFEVPREMIECHHYLTPLFNYTDWLDKPALPFVVIAACYKLFGMNALSARLPAALSGIVLIVATYVFTLKVIGKRAAILAALILSTSPLFLIVGHVALSDELLSMLFGLAMLFIGSALAHEKQRVSLIAFIFMALAILCKGPIALILAIGTVGVYIIAISDSSTQLKDNLFRLRPITFIITVGLLCLPYYYAAHIATSGAFTEQFFLRQNLGRLQGKVNHLEPIWFYLPVFFAGYLPWSLCVPLSLPWLGRLLRHRHKLNSRQKFILFCFCWFLFVAFLFTLVPTRLPTYIVPFSPALAIIIASYVDSFLRRKSIKVSLSPFKSKALLEDVLIVFTSVLVSFAGLGTLIGLIKYKVLTGNLLLEAIVVLIALIVLSLWACAAFWFKQYEEGFLSLILALSFACIVLVPVSFSWFYQNRQVIFEKVIDAVKERNGNLATLFSPVPSTIFYLRHPIDNIESLPQLAEFAHKDKGPHMLLASKNCLKIPQLEAQKHIIVSDGKWYLLDIEGYPW